MIYGLGDAMLKRYTEAGYQNIMSLKRWTGTKWKKCGFLRRWTGEKWIVLYSPISVLASLTPTNLPFNGYIKAEYNLLGLCAGYYVGDTRYYQKGYIDISNLEVGQEVSFEMKLSSSAFTRRYMIDGLYGISADTWFENTGEFATFTAKATKKTIRITCYTDYTETLFTLKNLMVDGVRIPLDQGGE